MNIFEWYGARSLPVKLGIVIALGTPFLINSMRRKAEPESSGAPQAEQSTPTTATATASETAIAFRSLDFPALREVAGDNITDEHLAQLTQVFGDKRVRWSGWVNEVREVTPGVFEVLVDMDSGGVSNGMGVVLAPADRFRSLRPGEAITFGGTVKSFMRVERRTFVRLQDVQIE